MVGIHPCGYLLWTPQSAQGRDLRAKAYSQAETVTASWQVSRIRVSSGTANCSKTRCWDPGSPCLEAA